MVSALGDSQSALFCIKPFQSKLDFEFFIPFVVEFVDRVVGTGHGIKANIGDTSKYRNRILSH
jgi:hypothetical protein